MVIDYINDIHIINTSLNLRTLKKENLNYIYIYVYICFKAYYLLLKYLNYIHIYHFLYYVIIYSNV